MNSQQTKSTVLTGSLTTRILWGLLVLIIGLFLLFLFYPFPDELESEENKLGDAAADLSIGKEETENAHNSRPFDLPRDVESRGDGRRADDEILLTLPSLRESDPFVREKASGWALPSIWIDNESLISRYMTLVTSVASGELPRRQLAFLAPKIGFKVFRDGEKIFVNPENYRRFDGLVDSIEALPVGRLARLLRELDPLFRLSVRQLGMRESPETLMLKALDRVIAVPVVPDKVELVQSVVVFKFVDPDLEELPEFEKQLIRMGPMNVERLRNFARKLKSIYLKT